jgi:hypothetical protein
MRGGYRQINDDFDARIGEQLIDRAALGDAEFGGTGLCTGDVDVGDGCNMHATEALVTILQIDTTDIATPDDTDCGTAHKILADRLTPYLIIWGYGMQRG